MGNDGGKVGRNFAGGGAPTAKEHQANIIPSGRGGAVSEEIGPVKGGNVNLGVARGSVSNAEMAEWVASGGTRGRMPVGAIRAKAADITQAANNSAFSAAERRAMGFQTKNVRANSRDTPYSLRQQASFTSGSLNEARARANRLNTPFKESGGSVHSVKHVRQPDGSYRTTVDRTMKPTEFKGVRLGPRTKAPQDAAALRGTKNIQAREREARGGGPALRPGGTRQPPR